MSDWLDVLYVAGRLSGEEGLWPLGPLLDALQQRSVRVKVLCLSRSAGAGQDARFIACPQLSARWLRPLTVRRLAGSDELRQARLIHIIHDRMNDVGLALADLCRVPYLRSVEDLERLAGVLRVNRRWCRGLVVPTDAHAHALVTEMGLSAELVRVVAPGIAPRPGGPPVPGGSIPVVGTAVPPGDLPALACFMEAARQVLDRGMDVEFLIGGQEDYSSEARRLAQISELGERISLVDASFLDAQFWAVLDVYCHPGARLGSFRTLLRAMAEGIPCLATRGQGIDRLIEDGHAGVLVPADDSEAIAEAIVGLIEDRERATTLGHRGRDLIRAHYPLDREADRLADLYWSIAKAGS